MKKWLIIFIFCTFLFSAEKIDLFEKDKELYGWKIGLGLEFKGAKGQLIIDDNVKYNGKPSLKLTGDFTEGGKYVEVSKNLDNLDIESFSFYVKYPKDVLTFRIIDSSGQCHQIRIKIKKTDDWQLVEFPLKKFFEKMGTSDAVSGIMGYEKWSGKNDGRWYGPAKFISILLSPDKNTGNMVTMWFNEFTAVVSEKKEKKEIIKTIPLDDLLKLGQKDWDLFLGTEFKGAKGNLDIVRDGEEYCLKLAADFTEGGAYIDTGKSLGFLNVDAIKSISLKLKSDNVKSFGIRIIDSSGQVLQKKGFKFTPDNKWHDVVINIDDFNGAEHWSGANDGKVHQPVKNIRIVLTTYSSEDKKPVLFIKDIKAGILFQGEVSGTVLEENFEDVVNISENWEIKGNINVIEGDSFSGKKSLVLERSEKNVNVETSALSKIFNVKPGILRIQGVGKSELYSPDNSYCGKVSVEFLDSNKKVIERQEVIIFTGKTNWQTFSKEIEINNNANSARVKIDLQKTYGKLNIDDLKISYISPSSSIVKKVQRIEISSERLGNLFYPEDEVSLNINVKTTLPLSDSEKTLKCEIKDYWGANQTNSLQLKLDRFEIDKGVLIYSTKLKIKEKLEIGKYYEIHITVPQEGEPFKEFSTFAILPEAITKKYKPEEIPFTQRNWDNRIREYFLLSDRLGIRICGIWSGFDFKPPYNSHAPGLELVNELGMKWVAGTPGAGVEHKRGNWEQFTEEVLKEGMKKFVEKYKNNGLYYICLGNEPPTDYENAVRNTKAYKAMYEGVKEVAPELIVLGTSVGPAENYFKAGFQKYLDMYDFHTYGDYREIPRIFKKYKELFSKYGGEKPICSTELGINSQGMTRYDVAKGLIKSITLFFACGGAHCSWFDLLYPDPQGKAETSAAQAHNVFYCKYNLYAPKLDAIAYYNIVNGICVKKFVESKVYPDGTEVYLFRDKEGNTLLVLWNDKSNSEFFFPLPEVDDVEVIRIDGSRRKLNAGKNGINLNLIQEEPVLILYRQNGKNIPEAFTQPKVRIISKPDYIIEGDSFKIVFEGENISVDEMEISCPSEFSIRKIQDGKKRVIIEVSIPENFIAREGRFRISMYKEGIDFFLNLPVVSKIEGIILPYPSCLKNGPGVRLILKNNGEKTQKVNWVVSIEKEFPMKNGTFNLLEGQIPNAYFKDMTNGTEELKSKEGKEILLSMEKVDPLTIYQIKCVVKDEFGRGFEFKRYISGFLGAPYRKEEIKIDGDLSESDWNSAPTAFLDKEQQVYYLKKLETEMWKGIEDLSGKLKFLWDEKYLYIGVEVIDDVHSTPYADGSIWNQDGLQFLFDPKRGEKEKKGKYDISIASGQKGLQCWSHLTADPAKSPTGEIKDVKIGFKRIDNKTIYEIAIPWDKLSPFYPFPGADLGVAMIINEDDGKGRVSFIGWFGCVHSKQMDMVGDLILLEKEK
ncbi:MAG TPA: sugar-binding protein [bacterium]|nr:sugar-binding protein [bacterium]